MGFLNNLGDKWNNFPQVKKWLECFQKDDLVTILGLYQWYEEGESEQNDLEKSLKIRKDALLVLKADEIMTENHEGSKEKLVWRESGEGKEKYRANPDVLTRLHNEVSLNLPVSVWERYKKPRFSDEDLKECLKKWAGQIKDRVDDDPVEWFDEDENGMIRLGALNSLSAGDTVKMLEGHFAGQEGLFSSMVGNQRVAILLDLMGRTIRVHAPRWWVATVT